MTEKEILQRLVVGERDVLKELESLVEKALKVFQIEKPSGRVIFRNIASLTNQQRILGLLAGKYYAHRAGIDVEYGMSISSIATEIGSPVTALSGPVKILGKKGLVVREPDRRYRIEPSRMGETIEYLLSGKCA